MRRRWLLRLYPPAWRRRYGEEFLALLEDVPFGRAIAIDVVRAAFLTRLRDWAGRTAPAARTRRLRMTHTTDPQAPASMAWSREIAPGPWQRRFALLGFVLLLPTLSFLFLVLLKYGMGIAAPFDRAEPFFLNRAVELFTVAAPWLAFVLSTSPTVRFRIGWADGSLTGMLAINARPMNLLVSALSAAVIAVLVVYFLVENF
jgi:hypothetical protein